MEQSVASIGVIILFYTIHFIKGYFFKEVLFYFAKYLSYNVIIRLVSKAGVPAKSLLKLKMCGKNSKYLNGDMYAG